LLAIADVQSTQLPSDQPLSSERRPQQVHGIRKQRSKQSIQTLRRTRAGSLDSMHWTTGRITLANDHFIVLGDRLLEVLPGDVLELAVL
jgi:hypothetical protein